MDAQHVVIAFDQTSSLVGTHQGRLFGGELIYRVPPNVVLETGSRASMRDALAHTRAMHRVAQTHLERGKTEKGMRWLCFAQGVLWATGGCTIDDLKEFNR